MTIRKYKFQFKTGNVCDGPTEIKVNDFVGEVADDQVNKSLELVIEARGGILVKNKPAKAETAKTKLKAKPVKWAGQDGEK